MIENLIIFLFLSGKECQRIFDCLVNNKPNTPSSIGSTPRDPRNGTQATPETPRGHLDPRRLSLERSNSVVETPSSSISTPSFAPSDGHSQFSAFQEQATPHDPNNPHFQIPEQPPPPPPPPPPQERVAHGMNSAALQQQYEQLKLYAEQQQMSYPGQTVDGVPHTPVADMFAQPALLGPEGYAMPQTPSVSAAPGQQPMYGHQQLPGQMNSHDIAAINYQNIQPFPAQSVNPQGYIPQEHAVPNQADVQGFPAHGQAFEPSAAPAQPHQPHHAQLQQHPPQPSKKQSFGSRSESYHSQRDNSQDSYQSRSFQSHSEKGHRHSNQSSSKRYNEDRGKGRYDYDEDRSKKWDRKDRQDFRSNKRYDRQRYKSQDRSEEEEEEGSRYHHKDYHSRGTGHYRSKDSDQDGRHRHDSYSQKYRRGYEEDEDKEYESGRSSKYGSKSKGYDKKYSESRTQKDDYHDRRRNKGRDDEGNSGDCFEKWRCPTGTETAVKVEEEEVEETLKFDKWTCPTEAIPPVEPTVETEKFEPWRPPKVEEPVQSPEEELPFEDWQCPPGEEPPPGTEPLVLPNQPLPPGTEEAPGNSHAKGEDSSEEADDLAQSLDTRIEKLLQSSQGPMAFAGFRLEDSGNAGKNNSTSGNSLQPPGVEEPVFSQSEESVRTSDAETSGKYPESDEHWNRLRPDQQGRIDQVDNQWSSQHPPHPSSVPHPRMEVLKGGPSATDPYHSMPHSTPTPPGSRHSRSGTPSIEQKVPQSVEMLISKQLANLRNYDQQIASRGTSPVSDLARDRSQTSTPGIEDQYSMHQVRGSLILFNFYCEKKKN